MSETKPQTVFLLHSYKFNIQIDYFPVCQSEMCPWFENRDPSSKSKDWKVRAESCSCWSQHNFCSWVQQRSTGCPWTPGAGGEHIIRKITGGEKDAKVHLTTMHNIFLSHFCLHNFSFSYTVCDVKFFSISTNYLKHFKNNEIHILENVYLCKKLAGKEGKEKRRGKEEDDEVLPFIY